MYQIHYPSPNDFAQNLNKYWCTQRLPHRNYRRIVRLGCLRFVFEWTGRPKHPSNDGRTWQLRLVVSPIWRLHSENTTVVYCLHKTIVVGSFIAKMKIRKKRKRNTTRAAVSLQKKHHCDGFFNTYSHSTQPNSTKFSLSMVLRTLPIRMRKSPRSRTTLHIPSFF